MRNSFDHPAAGGHAAPSRLALATGEREQRFNRHWRFWLGDLAGAEKSDFSEDGWRPLDLPHDWSVEAGFQPEGNASCTGYLPGGIGWYRKRFVLPREAAGKQVFLRFEGVYRHSDVWLNGVHLGGRPNGYIDFEYDLTAYLRARDEENVVAVRVARQNVADSRWYPGTGIYRDTWLTVTDPVHITRHGTFATAPVVDSEQAEVNSTCEVRNGLAVDATVTVTATVLDATGQRMGQETGSHDVAAGQTWVFSLYHPVARPRLWDVNDPYLYRIVHTVSVGGQTHDEVSTPLGIRSARFDANQGFFLNGRHVIFKGVCIHHDAGNLGAAVPRAVLERRLRLLKGIGVNAIRCSHNPMADDLYTLCDTLGLLVVDEAFDEWEGGKRKWVEGRNVGHAERYGYNQDFHAWAIRDLEDTVRRARRHPCVVLYSIGNEIDYPTDPYVHPTSQQVEIFKDDGSLPSMNRLAAVAPGLIAAVKRQDPTRPVTMALSNASAANATGLASMLDVVGYNYQEGAYDLDHRRFPSRILCGSENSHSPEAWFAVLERPFVCGQFLWTGFDFLGEADRWPRHGSGAGLFDTAGFPKANALLREALWSEKPVLHLRVFRGDDRSTAHWNALAHETEPAHVVAYTNLQEVSLACNGTHVGTVAAQGGVARWQFPWRRGRLEITGKSPSGELLADAIETTGLPATIGLQLDRASLSANCQEVIHAVIRLLDTEGRLVTDADRPVTVHAQGALRLLALETGNLNDNAPPQSATRATCRGLAMAILQPYSQADAATEIRVTTPGLPDATASVEIKN